MAKAHGKVEDHDHGYKALLARVKDENAVLTVGIHAAEGDAEHEGTGGRSIAEIGAFHEYGLGHNPRRSFIADWADENEEAHREMLRKIGRAVLEGKLESMSQGLDRLGALFVGEIQKRIADGIEPELAESTIKRKGSSVPLIDTGQLRSAITWKVGGGNGGEE
jgi:hypothetical protein